MVFVDVENELNVFMQIELLVILDLVITAEGWQKQYKSYLCYSETSHVCTEFF